MKLSKSEFEKLVSAYLDGEIEPPQAQTLSDCIRRDSNARAFFLHSCAVHKAMLNLYGKRAKFPKIAAFDVEKCLESRVVVRRRALSDWSAAACLFAASIGLMCAAMRKPESSAAEDSLQAPRDFEARIADSLQVSDAEVTIISVYPTRSILAP